MQILVLFILVAINAFFAASEMAFVTLNDVKIASMAKEGNKKARTIEKMLNKPSKFLATIQIGITLAGFLSSAFAADAFADDLAPMLENLIPLGIGVWESVSIVLITIIHSYFSLVLYIRPDHLLWLIHIASLNLSFISISFIIFIKYSTFSFFLIL